MSSKDSRDKKAGSSRPRRRASTKAAPESGRQAHSGSLALHSYNVGALPLVNHILDRMQLEELLKKHLPADDPRTVLPTASALMVLVRNVLVSREPMYGVRDWTASFPPDLFNIWEDELALLGDDRMGRALSHLFQGAQPDLLLAVVRHVMTTFDLSLDELHNDSTTISFYGAYTAAAEERRQAGRLLPAITWGHSKARRPDLKQLLYTLTITNDGGVPIYFTTSSGNTADDRTHIATWDLLCQLVGGPDFLYVADCKLASVENLTHLATRGGRFVTVLPRTRKEDELFRQRLRSEVDTVRRNPLFDMTDDDGQVIDRWSTMDDETPTADGFRLLWYHSTRKAELDAEVRQRRIAQTVQALNELRGRLLGPRTRYRQRSAVEQAVERLLSEHKSESWLTVTIVQQEEASFRQAQAGRPTSNTQYFKTTRDRYDLTWQLNATEMAQAPRDDGVFPLLTNDRKLSAKEVLQAYKRQPVIEKRFSQFKTEFAVAPVYLHDVGRIGGLLAVYFFALIAQSLLERELRRAMAAARVTHLTLYPEGRPCTRPTTARIIELFDPIQRHRLQTGDNEPQIMVTELTALQRQVLRLLHLNPDTYGHGIPT